jgi:hypothetical protein
MWRPCPQHPDRYRMLRRGLRRLGRAADSRPRFRKRAERRLREVMEADRKAGKLAKGTRGQLKGKTSSGGLRKNPPEGGRSLKKQGIDKNLADRDREAAALPEKKFEAEVERVVGTAVAAVTFKMYRRRLQRPSGFDRPSRAQPLGVGIGGLAPGVVDLMPPFGGYCPKLI